MENTHKQDVKQQWLQFAEQSFIGEKIPTSTSSGFMGSNITKQTIDNLLKSPYQNYKTLQNYSHLFMIKEGVYYRIIKLLSSILTYDYLIYPNIEPNAIKGKKKSLKESYSKASVYLEKMNIKTNAIRFTEDFLTDGECYYYKIEDSLGIIYEKIDNKYCLPYSNENDVWKYVIDMQSFSSVNDITTYPMELQRALSLYKTDRNNRCFILGQYYPVKNGFCFSTVTEAKHGIPPYSFLFGDLISLENKKDLKDKVDKINSTKMIHNKIDTSNKETTVDPEVAKKYNSAIKQNLINKNLEGVFTITNPFDAQILNLDTTSSRTENLVPNSITQIFSEIGISEMFFNCGTSAEALKKSTITTSSLMINLILGKINAYVNYELKKQPTKIKMLCKILDCTIFDREEKKKVAREEMAYGGSRLMYLALNGMTPLQSTNIFEIEKALNIDSYFVPIETSHTQSGKGGQNKGRKSQEQIETDGGEVSEITEQVNDRK
ncbi:TPA: hypothetical protein LA460_000239 [Clostridium botulinum]|nr:hypothetical protein [Clostridium botulinum]HBJ1652843.1 hypothetical protein [Clostridium botulinum]